VLLRVAGGLPAGEFFRARWSGVLVPWPGMMEYGWPLGSALFWAGGLACWWFRWWGPLPGLLVLALSALGCLCESGRAREFRRVVREQMAKK